MNDPPSYGTFIEFEICEAKGLRMAVFSYFWNIYRFSGLRVPLAKGGESTRRRVTRRARWIVAVLILFLLLYRVVFRFFTLKNMGFSYEWTLVLIELCLAVHCFVSAATLFLWNRRGLLKEFLRAVSTTSAHKTIGIANVVSIGPYKVLFTLNVIITLLAEVFRTTDTLLEATWGKYLIGRPLFLHEQLYPLEVLLNFYSLGISLTAVALFYLMTSLMFAEFKQFNKELSLAATNQRLQDEEVFRSFSNRHFDLLHLLRKVNIQVGVFVTTTIGTGLLVHFFAMFILTNFAESSSWAGIVTCSLLFFTGSGFAVAPMHRAAALISEAHESSQILLFEKSVGETLRTNECMQMVEFYKKRMIGRLRKGEYYVKILRAFNLTPSSASTIYLVAFLMGLALSTLGSKLVHKDDEN